MTEHTQPDPELQALRERRLRELTATRAETPAPAEPLTVTDATLDQALRDHPLLVVDLWAPWCGPCRHLAPILDDLARDLAGRVTIAKLNVDENPAAARRFQVTGIPTMLVFRHGKLVDRLVGGAPRDTLRERFLAHAPGVQA